MSSNSCHTLTRCLKWPAYFTNWPRPPTCCKQRSQFCEMNGKRSKTEKAAGNGREKRRAGEKDFPVCSMNGFYSADRLTGKLTESWKSVWDLCSSHIKQHCNSLFNSTGTAFHLKKKVSSYFKKMIEVCWPEIMLWYKHSWALHVEINHIYIHLRLLLWHLNLLAKSIKIFLSAITSFWEIKSANINICQ